MTQSSRSARLPAGVWPRARVLPQVFAHLPDGLTAYGIRVIEDGKTIPIAHEGRSVRAYVGGEPHEEAMDLKEWSALVATGTAWILTDDHVELAPPAETPAEPARQPVASRLPPGPDVRPRHVARPRALGGGLDMTALALLIAAAVAAAVLFELAQAERQQRALEREAEAWLAALLAELHIPTDSDV